MFWLVFLLGAASVIGGGCWHADPSNNAGPPEEGAAPIGPMVHVKTTPLRRETMQEKLITYGTVVAALGKTQIVSEPFETRVRQVFVTSGESVDVGSPLIEIEPSPDTQLQFDQAKSELQAAQDAERLAKESFTMKLTTRQDLNTVEQRLLAAELALQSMTDRGIADSRTIEATARGVVMQINTQPGHIASAGSPLLALIGKNQINVQLGIEYEDIGNLHIDQAVRILPIHESEGRATDGVIRLITRQVNPQTRLIDVYVAPAPNAQLMLNEYVRGEITAVAEKALVAPRSAVVPEEDHYVVYTVEHDRAVRHEVKVGIENELQIQIFATDLKMGQLIVVSGNSELQDGMAVESEPAP